MARLSRKQQQDKRELLSSLNHVNNCIGSKHAVENRKYNFLLAVCEIICGAIFVGRYFFVLTFFFNLKIPCGKHEKNVEQFTGKSKFYGPEWEVF